jgi:hypothetical protein
MLFRQNLGSDQFESATNVLVTCSYPGHFGNNKKVMVAYKFFHLLYGLKNFC